MNKQYNIGDLLEAKHYLHIGNENGETENSKKGDLFIILDKHLFQEGCIRYTLMKQTSGNVSLWDAEHYVFEDFRKIEV